VSEIAWLQQLRKVRIVVEAQPMEKGLEWTSEESLVSTRRDIIWWWEARRFRFNVLVGAVGIVTWLLVMFAGSAAVKPGEDFEEPIAMLFGPFVYAALANVCYTLGWVVDTILYRGTPRTRLYKAGLIFSIVLTALPGLWAVVAWLITVYTGRKLD
jgi:hypothetical protein